ncbi:alpha/beta hydrolase [Miltoncostaea oceani]|uniref:alpha/beta hydrolase n=1 Tax=Miltoncostaea oceani TaxID=2843216 RepID=UPI001FE2F6E3|nr:alpha/beta hydrolase [Miltoncostaea oceani]
MLLVHGAWGGAWAWGFVQAELDKLGVTSTAIDLPSRERAPSTMADDAATVREALAGFAEPAVLVGHSYCGVVITEASAGNEKVKELVYVCAILPEEGQSTGSLMGEDPQPSDIGSAIRSDEEGMSILDPVGAKAILFNDVTDEQAAPIIAALGPHRLAVFGEAPTALGWKEHPSTYILTTQDKVFSPALQRRMAVNATRTVEVDAGHIPLLSRPSELAAAIAEAANR